MFHELHNSIQTTLQTSTDKKRFDSVFAQVTVLYTTRDIVNSNLYLYKMGVILH